MTIDTDLPKKAAILQLKKAKEPTIVGTIFQNWLVVGTKETKKKTKDGLEVITNTPVYAAKRPSELVEELKVFLPNFINVNGDLTELRDDPKTGYFLPRTRFKPDDVEASLYAKDVTLGFKNNLDGSARWAPLIIHYRDCVREVSRVTKYPSWPLKSDHLVLAPGIEPQANGSLDRLVDFFCPETETDRKLIKALFVTPAWSEGQGKRPLFLIMGPRAADSNVSIGKSKLAEKLQKLYQAGADFPQEVKPERWLTTIMEMQTAQIVRFDNVRVAEWASTILERIVTSEMISGHKHGVGHREYPNHITFVATINDPHLNADLASRSVVIRVKKPETYGAWERNVDTWIAENRIDVLRDIASILMSQNVPDPDMNTQFRFPQWKETILNKIDANLGDHIKAQSEVLKGDSGTDEWLDYIIDKVCRYTYATETRHDRVSTENHRIFVSNSVIAQWWQEWHGLRVTGRLSSSDGRKLKTLCVQAKMLYGDIVKVGDQPTRGYWVNPSATDLRSIGIATQIRESNHALPITIGKKRKN